MVPISNNKSGSVAAFYLGAALLAALATAPAAAMVGGAQPAAHGAGRSVVMVLGSHGTACTATAIARNLLLTAAHCVEPGSEYKLADLADPHAPTLKPIARIERDPQFEMKRLLGHRATADVALVLLPQPLPTDIPPVALDDGIKPVAVGDSFVVAGYGVTVRGDGRTGGTVRAATLVATGQPNTLQLRLFDPPGEKPRGSAPAPAIPARRRFATPTDTWRSSAWSAGRPGRNCRPAAAA